jgi:hypothetical protein
LTRNSGHFSRNTESSTIPLMSWGDFSRPSGTESRRPHFSRR